MNIILLTILQYIFYAIGIINGVITLLKNCRGEQNAK